MPPAARGPVLTVSRPILSGAPCAIEGMGKAAAAAAATKRRRVVLMIIASSRGSAVLMQPECLNARRAVGIQSQRCEEANPDLTAIKCGRLRQALRKWQTPGACVRDYTLRHPA